MGSLQSVVHRRRAARVALVVSLAATLTASLAVSGAAATADAPIVRGELGATLDDWLTRMEAFGMHGAMLVEANGEVAIAKGYGVAHHASGRRITRDTSFHLGSLGKQFTAACILKLEMMGRLSVGDLLSEHLDDVPDDKASITIHHLLTHTAGLPYLPTEASPLELPLRTEPGARWAYSNPGYTVLAHIVERVGGMPLGEFATKHLFAPAGMDHTTWIGNPDWPTEDVAYSYQDDNDLGPVSADEPDPRFHGAGDFASTVGDLLKWEHALRGEAILSDAAKEKFFTEHVRNPGSRVGYAYGWMTTTTERGTRIVFHQGNFGGFNSDYRRYIDEGVTIVFLSNHYLAGRSMRDAVVNNVSRLINGDAAAVPMPPRVVAADLVPPGAKVEASFAVGDDERITTRWDGDALLLRGWGQRATHLIFAPDADESARAFADAASRSSVDAVLAAAHGDDSVLRASTSRSVMPDQLASGMREQLAAWTAKLGALDHATSLGTALTGQANSGRVTVRLTFERGERLADIAWGAGGGIYQVVETDAPPARRFLPSEHGLVAFDIFTGNVNEIALQRGTDAWTLHIGGEVLTAAGWAPDGI